MSARRDPATLTDAELEAETERRRQQNALAATDDATVLVGAITDRLGLSRAKLVRVVRYRATDGNLYHLVFDGDRVAELTTSELLTRHRARPCIYDAVDEVVTTPTPEWDALVGMIGRAATDEELGREATDAGLCDHWLEEYAGDDGYETDDPGEFFGGMRATHVLVHEGERYLHGPRLRDWLTKTMGERGLTHKRTGTVLRAGGCEPVRLDLQARRQAGRAQAVEAAHGRRLTRAATRSPLRRNPPNDSSDWVDWVDWVAPQVRAREQRGRWVADGLHRVAAVGVDRAPSPALRGLRPALDLDPLPRLRVPASTRPPPRPKLDGEGLRRCVAAPVRASPSPLAPVRGLRCVRPRGRPDDRPLARGVAPS